MELINRFSRRELKESEVYRFSVILCDNEIDRDGEKFTISALKKLAELYVGKTGIFSHDPRGENQTARVYSAEVVKDSTRTTTDGEPYHYLKAHAYMIRTDSNADLIKEIDGGIKKEVSVGCAISRETCSICGKDVREGRCSHKKGRVYNGRKCFYILDEPTDAYEWSFVAVPAQRMAGVTKRYDPSAVTKSRDDGILEELTAELRREILRLSFLEGDSVPLSLTKAAILRMDPAELLSMKRGLEKKLSPAGCELEKAVDKAAGEKPHENKSYRI